MHHVENVVESGIIHIDKALDNVGLEVKYSNELVAALRFRGGRGEVVSKVLGLAWPSCRTDCELTILAAVGWLVALAQAIEDAIQGKGGARRPGREAGVKRGDEQGQAGDAHEEDQDASVQVYTEAGAPVHEVPPKVFGLRLRRAQGVPAHASSTPAAEPAPALARPLHAACFEHGFLRPWQ